MPRGRPRKEVLGPTKLSERELDVFTREAMDAYEGEWEGHTRRDSLNRMWRFDVKRYGHSSTMTITLGDRERVIPGGKYGALAPHDEIRDAVIYLDGAN